MKKLLSVLTVISMAFAMLSTLATTQQNSAPTPTAQISHTVAYSGSPSQWWSTIKITFTNDASQSIDLNGATITFNSPVAVTNGNVNFNAESSGISWPTNTSLSNNGQEVSYKLGFGNESWVKTKLAPGKSFALTVGIGSSIDLATLAQSVKIYTGDTPSNQGAITIQAPVAPGPNAGQNASASITGDHVQQTVQVAWNSSKTISNLPYGKYTIATNQVGPYQGGADQYVTLTDENKTVTINLHYQPPVPTGHVKLTMPTAPIANAPEQKLISVNISKNSAPTYIPVSWGNTIENDSLTVNDQYAFYAAPFTYNGVEYTPNYTKANPATIKASADNTPTINFSYSGKPIPTVSAQVKIEGLPSGADPTIKTTLTGTDNNHYQFELKTGSNNIHVVPGIYKITVASVSINGKTYAANVNNPYSIGKDTIITLTFAQGGNSRIAGWPDYLAMGTVVQPVPSVTSQLEQSPVDVIFTYAGFDGGGDRGQIIDQTGTTKTIKTMEQARAVEKATGKKVLPMLIFYTVEASGGFWGANQDVFNNDDLMKHYINLIFIANKMQSYKDAEHPYPGTLLLNPDFVGMLQQNPGGQADQILNDPIAVNAQLENALSYVKSQGITVPTNVPSFTNNINGYIQSINYLVRTFGPNITFGWQANLWAPGSATWVKQNLTPAQIKTISDSVANIFNQLGVYSGPYKPDFLAFDKYERDGFGNEARPVGYAFNARDWKNYVAFANDVSRALDTPAVLWQIPGGHMATAAENYDKSWLELHSANAPDFFLGNSAISSNLNAIDPTVLALTTPATIYGGANTILQYLQQDNGYDWSQNNLLNAVDNNIVAILWGGGSTTGVVTIGTNGDDNGWLANKLKHYYQQPTPLK